MTIATSRTDRRPTPLAGWVENGPTSSRLSRAWFRELWSFRELGIFFAWKELKLRYKQAVLGVAWIFLQPVLGTLLFTLLFERAVHVPSDGVPYPVFAYVGLAVWAALSTAVSRAGEVLTEDPDLVTKVYFPRLLAPIGAVLPATVDVTIALTLAIPLMAIYDVTPPLAVLLLPLCIVGLVLVALAIGTWLSALHVLYRDVRYAMTFGLQAWLFASPILYPSSLIEGSARLVYFLNPAAGLVNAFRACLLGTPLDPAGVGISAASLAVIGLSGLVYFRRVERAFADRI
jgi:ABC-type polysaccharide/polyol phosphate export permease